MHTFPPMHNQPIQSPFHVMLHFRQILLSLFMLLSFLFMLELKQSRKLRLYPVIPLDLQPGLFTRYWTQCEKAVFSHKITCLCSLCSSPFSKPLFQQRVQSTMLHCLFEMLISLCFYSGWFLSRRLYVFCLFVVSFLFLNFASSWSFSLSFLTLLPSFSLSQSLFFSLLYPSTSLTNLRSGYPYN